MNMKLSEKGLKRLIKNCVDKIPSPYSCGDGSEEPTYNLIVKKEWYHNRNKTSIKDYRFNQNDFEGCVSLTIEEATSLNEVMEWLCSIVEGYERERDNSTALVEGWNQMDFLENKIEQAKGK